MSQLEFAFENPKPVNSHYGSIRQASENLNRVFWFGQEQDFPPYLVLDRIPLYWHDIRTSKPLSRLLPCEYGSGSIWEYQMFRSPVGEPLEEYHSDLFHVIDLSAAAGDSKPPRYTGLVIAGARDRARIVFSRSYPQGEDLHGATQELSTHRNIRPETVLGELQSIFTTHRQRFLQDREKQLERLKYDDGQRALIEAVVRKCGEICQTSEVGGNLPDRFILLGQLYGSGFSDHKLKSLTLFFACAPKEQEENYFSYNFLQRNWKAPYTFTDLPVNWSRHRIVSLDPKIPFETDHLSGKTRFSSIEVTGKPSLPVEAKYIAMGEILLFREQQEPTYALPQQTLANHWEMNIGEIPYGAFERFRDSLATISFTDHLKHQAGIPTTAQSPIIIASSEHIPGFNTAC